MATAVLGPDFFNRSALRVARDLIGATLVRQQGPVRWYGAITETEAYIGPHDAACHAFRGRTARTAVMFGPPGVWYVYFVYGIHWMLNVVTEAEDYPAAVLLRGAGQIVGPARLTKALAIDRRLNGLPAAVESGLWIEAAPRRVPARQIERTARIGVEYAGPWAGKPYRFVWRPS